MIPTVGGSSSSSIVPLAVGSAASCARLVGVGFDSVTVKVWSGSSVVSAAATVNVVVVAFAAMVTVPVVSPVRSAAAALSPPSIDAVQSTVTFCGTAFDSVTVNSTPTSSAPSASATLSAGRVPSSIVPVAAEGVPSVTFPGFDSVRVKVSALSSSSSGNVGTSIVPAAVPSAAAMVSVPLVDVKSVPETASSPVATDVA